MESGTKVWTDYSNLLLSVVGWTGAVVSATDYGPRVPGSRPGRVAVCCGLEQVTFPNCFIVLVKPRKPWTYD